MRCFPGLVVVAGLLIGCEARPVPIAPPPVVQTGVPSAGSTTTDDSSTPGSAATGLTAVEPAPATASSETATSPAPAAANADKTGTPVALSGGVAILTPENTKIQFVGTHMPPKQPEPRTGGFAKFEGQAQVDPATKKLLAVSVDIETASLFTGIDRLNNHLKSGDFFEVREHPKARFESSKITSEEADKATITGNLTLHGVTKELSFPASVQIGDEGLTLKSEFSIDRTDFGIAFDPGQVEKKVALTVVIGEKTEPK